MQLLIQADFPWNIFLLGYLQHGWLLLTVQNELDSLKMLDSFPQDSPTGLDEMLL